MKTTIFLCGLLLLPALAFGAPDKTPAPHWSVAPSRVLAAGKPIDVPTGHAAPFLVDWNRDGRQDLLVGQFGGGKLRIFLNQGTSEAPAYETWTYFQAGGQDATVPAS